MKYLRLNDLERHEKNPFVEKAIEEIRSVKKMKHFTPTKKNEMQLIVSREGEVTGETAFIKYIEVEEEKFAKLYLSQFSAFHDLNKSAIKLFGYILTMMKPNLDYFYFDINDALEFTEYKGKNTILNAMASLVKNGIVARSSKHYMYFINPLVIFNGSRVTFAKSYIKKSKGDPNQISLFEQEERHKLPPAEK